MTWHFLYPKFGGDAKKILELIEMHVGDRWLSLLALHIFTMLYRYYVLQPDSPLRDFEEVVWRLRHATLYREKEALATALAFVELMRRDFKKEEVEAIRKTLEKKRRLYTVEMWKKVEQAADDVRAVQRAVRYDLSPSKAVKIALKMRELPFLKTVHIKAERLAAELGAPAVPTRIGLPYGYAKTANPAKALAREFAYWELFEAKAASGSLLARETRLVETRGDVVILVDASGSMRDWFELAVTAAYAVFLAAKSYRKKIVVYFSENVVKKSEVETPADFLEAVTFGGGGTSIDAAVAECAEELRGSTAFLFTDAVAPLSQKAAETLRQSKLNVVVFGGRGGETAEKLAQIAAETKGVYAEVYDIEDFKRVKFTW